MEEAKRLLALCLLCGSAAAACGGDSSGPEQQTVRVVTVPVGWGTVGDAPASYALGLDSTSRHAGAASAYVTTSMADPKGFMGVVQSLRADAYRGQRVRLSAWVRHTQVGGEGGALWMRIDGPRVVQAFDNMSTNSRRLRGTSDWHQVSIVLDVHTSAVGIGFGFFLDGTGDLQVDDMVLEPVPTTVPVTAVIVGSPLVLGDSAYVASFYASRPAAPTNLDFEAK